MSLYEKPNDFKEKSDMVNENKKVADELAKMRRQIDRHLSEVVPKLREGDYKLEEIEKRARLSNDYVLLSKVKMVMKALNESLNK
jgi:hypothetical protein